MWSAWSIQIDLPDDVLEVIQMYRRIEEAKDRRINILRAARLCVAWNTNVWKSYFLKQQSDFLDLILVVPSTSAVPFHNKHPFEVYKIDGTDVRIGMWEDRNNLIYIHGNDIQAWNFIKHVSVGQKPFQNSKIYCKRIRFQKKWYG